MQKITVLKALIMSFTLLMTVESIHASYKTRNNPTIMQQADKAVGLTLHGIGTGIAIGGIAVGTYQCVQALKYWIKANSTKLTEKQEQYIAKRNQSFVYSLAAICTAGVAYTLPKVSPHCLMHFDIGAFILGVLNIFFARR